jgi:hypothetical protein
MKYSVACDITWLCNKRAHTAAQTHQSINPYLSSTHDPKNKAYPR